MEYQRLIKIDSDGTPRHTVISTEEGKELDRVQSVRWQLDIHTPYAEVELELTGQAIHAEGHVSHVTFHCPLCNHMREHRCNDPSTDL